MASPAPMTTVPWTFAQITSKAMTSPTRVHVTAPRRVSKPNVAAKSSWAGACARTCNAHGDMSGSKTAIRKNRPRRCAAKPCEGEREPCCADDEERVGDQHEPNAAEKREPW